MSRGISAELLTFARKLNNWEEDPVTGLKVLWTSTTHFIAEVPADKRWFLFGGVADRNVSSTLYAYVKDASDEIILLLAYHSAGTSMASYPIEANVGKTIFPFVMDEGEYVDLTFGTAQDAGSKASCVVLEVDA